MSLVHRRGRALTFATVGSLLAALVLVGLVGTAPPAAASCAAESLRGQASRVDAVLAGVVRRAGERDRRGRYVIDVERVFQGQVSRRIRLGGDPLRTPELPHLAEGERWLLFADRTGTARYRFAACGGSMPVGTAALRRVADRLGPGHRAAAGPVPAPGAGSVGPLGQDSVGEPDRDSILAGAVGLVALGAVLGGWLLVRRARRSP